MEEAKVKTTANRSHSFVYGHRVVGHEGRCKQLHGHGAEVIFYCHANELDRVGRVVDFSVIKTTLCQWLEDNWDHKMLLWEKDSIASMLFNDGRDLGVVLVPFNPTAENMAAYLLTLIGPMFLPPNVKLVKVEFFETPKCSVVVEL